MNELQGYIAAALNGLMIGKYKGATELSDDALKWYANYAVKIGKATMEANTTPVVPIVPPIKTEAKAQVPSK